MDEWNGEFELVDPRLIVVDHTYQRPEQEGLIARIAEGPDWAAFGAVTCRRRESGMLVAVDGQQRLRGVLRCEKPPKKVPCIILSSASRQDEASSFVDINVTRKAVDAYAKYKAQLIAKDPAALAVNRAVELAGYTVGSGGNQAEGRTVMAISTLFHVYRQLGEEGIVQVLTQAREAWPDEPLGVSVNLLRVICEVIMEQGENYERQKLSRALSKTSPALILRKADELRFELGGSKQTAVRRAVKVLCKV